MGVPEAMEKKFSRPEAVFGSYSQLETKIGEKGVIVPKADAAQADKDAFYNSLGRPEKPEGYGFKKPDKIGDKAVPDTAWDGARATAWQNRLHALGLTAEQANGVMMGAVEESMQGADMIAGVRKQIYDTGVAALKKEWGADYDKNLAAAKGAAEEFGGKEVLTNPAIENDPAVIKMLAKIGLQLSERPGSGLRQQASSNKMSAADAKAEGQALTAEIGKKTKADKNWGNTAEAAKLKARKTELFKLAYPE